MIKRILLLLGETPASVSARIYAFALAQVTGARLSGLAGIDLSYIEARMPGAVGGIAWKVRLEEQLRKQADDVRRRLRETFEQECVAHKMAFNWLSFEGDPIKTLHMAAETRDLIITGHDTAFHGNMRVAVHAPLEGRDKTRVDPAPQGNLEMAFTRTLTHGLGFGVAEWRSTHGPSAFQGSTRSRFYRHFHCLEQPSVKAS